MVSAALNYFGEEHYGYIIAGEFHRGHHRGGGRYVNSFARDRIRALQLMTLALDKIEARNEGHWSELSDFYFQNSQEVVQQAV